MLRHRHDHLIKLGKQLVGRPAEIAHATALKDKDSFNDHTILS